MSEPAAQDRPLLVMVPGLGLGPEAWAPTAEALVGARVTVAPLPGYGERADPHVDLHPRQLAGTLADRIDAPRLVLLGHSASCQVVAHAAGLWPDRVAALVLVGPTTDPRGATWPGLSRRWLATAVHETPRQVPLLTRLYRRTTLRTMLRAMSLARRDDIRAALASAGCPVLVVRGRHDRICPEEWAADLGSAVTLPAGGHMVPLTHGDLVAAEVQRFLDAQVPSGNGSRRTPPNRR